jgi:hypothetical protein
LTSDDVRWPGWLSRRFPTPADRSRLVLRTAAAIGLGMCVYGISVVPFLQRRSKVKPIAAQIDALVPAPSALYAIDPDYQPFLFYTRSRIVYLSRLEDAPVSAQYLLVQPGNEQSAMESERWRPRHARPIFSATDYRKRSVILLKVE